jgi:3-hydroxymyristoyl/3-hydroxydecanoyl-(acyl carrier protein) dehydratase
MQEFDLETRVVGLPDADGRFPLVRSVTADCEHLRVMFDITSDLIWFHGHFPGQPVLPGVVQLHWAVLVATTCLDVAGVPTEIKRLKFKKVFTPPQGLELTLRECGSAEAQFRFSFADEEYSEGRLLFPSDAA